MTDTLLPNNATPLERAIATAAARVSGVPVPLADFWSPERCLVALLPWLAWALSVDEWDPGWPEETKRAVIAASIGTHRRKGTRWSIRRALDVAGYGSARILEDFSANLHGGALTHGGAAIHMSSNHWAEYRIVLDRVISIRQAARVRAVLAATAPARCHLVALDFREAQNLHNSAITHAGTHTHGVA